jgi:hypothetical protein
MKFANLALAVALASAAVVTPKEKKAELKIDCERAGEKAPVCEVKRKELSARPDLFQHAKPKPKTVHL